MEGSAAGGSWAKTQALKKTYLVPHLQMYGPKMDGENTACGNRADRSCL